MELLRTAAIARSVILKIMALLKTAATVQLVMQAELKENGLQ